MRYLVLILSVLVCASCMHTYDNSIEFKEEYKKRASQKSDTLLVHSMGCTECSDLYIDEGKLSLPPDLIYVNSTVDIKICGNFPVDLISPSSWNFQSGLHFKIVGKAIKIFTGGGNGRVALFYVESWEKFRLDKVGQ